MNAPAVAFVLLLLALLVLLFVDEINRPGVRATIVSVLCLLFVALASWTEIIP